MKRNWEVFQGRQYRSEARKEPRVTLGKSGIIMLNAVAVEAMERPAAVEMMFDGNRRLIGLRPCDPAKHNAFLLKSCNRGKYKRISAAAFCSQHRLKFDRTLLFEQVDLGEGGVLELDLNKTFEISRGAR